MKNDSTLNYITTEPFRNTTPINTYDIPTQTNITQEQIDQIQTTINKIHQFLLKGNTIAAWVQLAQHHQTQTITKNQTPIEHRYISDSNLDQRIIDILDKHNIIKWAQFKTITKKDLQAIQNIGPAYITQIQQELARQIKL